MEYDTEPRSPVRVFVVDDHELLRRGVAEIVSEEDGLELVGQAGTVAEGLQGVLASRPDVALLDIRLPDGDGVSLCREIRAADPGIRCLMFTSFDDDEAPVQAVLAGASGFLLKSAPTMELIRAIRSVAAGGALLDPAVTRSILDRLQAPADPARALSDQERRLLGLIGEGLTNREIAGRLFLSERTVRNYVSRLLAKLGVKRRAQAAAYAAKHPEVAL